MLVGAGPLRAQVNSGLEAGLHAVLVHGNLLDLQALSTDLGVEIYLPPTGESGQFLRGTVTRSPPTMYATGLSFSARVDKTLPRTQAELHFAPRECWPLQNWAKDWNQQVEFGVLTDAAGSWSSLQWGGPDGITLSATYFTGGGCSFDLRQTLNVLPRFTEAPPQPPQTQFEQKIAELVRHGDLRDYQWTAKTLNADLQVERSEVRDGKLFKGSVRLAQVIPGVRADSFSYYANDTGWTNFPGAIVYMGQKLASRLVQLSFALETQQLCLPPTNITTSLQHFGISYRMDSSGAAIRYEVEGDNAISITVDVSPAQEQQCVSFVNLRQTTDSKHDIKTPVEISLLDSLEADRLSGAAVQRMDLIGERLQGKIVKEVVVFVHPVAETDHSAQTFAHLTDLLRAALVEKGVRSELIRLQEDHYQAKAEGSIAIDVLVQ